MQRIPFSFFFFFFLTNFIIGQSEKVVGTKQFWDIPYLEKSQTSNDSLQRLNLVVPKADGSRPILVWIGGGAWSYGDRNEEMGFAEKLAEKGIAVACVGHRLSPAVWRDPKLKKGVQHPKHAEDVANAVKWLCVHSNDYNLDLKNLFIGGYSSGAHLATLISLDPTYLNSVGLSTAIFKGILPISGTYDIPNYHQVFLNGNRPELAEQHVEAVFGSTKEQLIQASPVTYLENLLAPMLIMSDNRVYRYTHLFEEQIRKLDFKDVRVVYGHNFSHGELWKDLSFAKNSRYRNMIIDFITVQNL